MAYTPVPTVATGDTWTAAMHNTYIQANFAAGVPAIFTTKGDIAVGSGASAAVRLPAGDNYSILKSKSSEASGLQWSGLPPCAMLYSTSSQGVISGTYSRLQFNTVVMNEGGYTFPNMMEIVIPQGLTGNYKMSFVGYFTGDAGSAGKVRQVRLATTNIQYEDTRIQPTDSQATWINISAFGVLAWTQAASIDVFHNTGVLISVVQFRFAIVRVG